MLVLVKRCLWILLLLACAGAPAADDAAIIATLTNARRLTPTGEGFQLVSQDGMWLRVVRTVDGGYSIFGTNGSARLFRTPLGFGYNGRSNDLRSVTLTRNGFSISSASGTVSMVRAGSAWLDEDSTNNYRVIVSAGNYATFSGPLAPTPADTVFERFQQRSQQNETDRQFLQPPPERPGPQPPAPGTRSGPERAR